MYQQDHFASSQKRFSLPVQVSLWLLLAAILPLTTAIIFSEWDTRPALIAQANSAMLNDAKTHMALIQAYLHERQLDAQTLTQLLSVQSFLHEPFGTRDSQGQKQALDALTTESLKDPNYVNWSLFDTRGRVRLSTSKLLPPSGKSPIPPAYQLAMKARRTIISDVSFDPQHKTETVDIYSPIFSSPNSGIRPPASYLGFVRATLKLDIVSAVINDDQENNGPDSYALLLDEHGTLIATNMPAPKAVPQAQQTMHGERRYATSTPNVSDLASRLRSIGMHKSATFQIQLAGKSEPYEVVEQSYETLQWHYLVLSPLNTITTLANQQLLFVGLIVLALGLFAIITGLIAARRVTTSLIALTQSLLANRQALHELALRQQDAAAEQVWAVESSQTGLQSVQYYTESIAIAAHSLSGMGTTLTKQWNYLEKDRIRVRLDRILLAVNYIEKASGYQKNSTIKLETSLKAAAQAIEQLATGTTSATQAATQLEEIIDHLRSVIGR
jgi:hypothetical protein